MSTDVEGILFILIFLEYIYSIVYQSFINKIFKYFKIKLLILILLFKNKKDDFSYFFFLL